ncbi:CheY chemotaxis protein or a CheY-like REC (receiver) domain [Palleronia marisminoris]|uniref:Two-component response regulator n=2 Tax=Palleronia marisminoris TaxID=315423 RepID=A0A1Y5TU91_9RHOB|nr:CheY chemotaxis protein or a CheY-like REC (receiver) domain [Palleronia marisminoris]SLN68336.1 two-component response regulator [Palleronia marisminoris]
MLLAMDLEMLLEDQGYEVLQPVRNVERALAVLGAERPDVVTLDMNLNGESSAPVATALREQNIPFVVVTGYTAKHGEEPAFRDAPLVKKPYDTVELLRALTHLLTG